MHRPLAQFGIDAFRWLGSAESLYKTIVTTYAIPLAIVHDSFEDDYVINDFFYYCFTKSTKSLAATRILLNSGFGEDAQVLIRSSYESYLAMAFVVANPERLDDVVGKKIGLKTGGLAHPIAPNGRTDRRKVVDTESGEIYPFGLSVGEMATLTGYPEDTKVHRLLYEFLSEHSHVQMMASGNYRDSTSQRYAFDDQHQVLQAKFYALYVYLIILAELAKFQKLSPLHGLRTQRVLRNGMVLLERASTLFSSEGEIAALPGWMTSRVQYCARIGGNA